LLADDNIQISTARHCGVRRGFDHLSDAFASLLGRLSSQLTVAIDEFNGLMPNHMYKATETYLGTKLCPSTRRIRWPNKRTPPMPLK